jgi:hypothetical protein
MAPQLVELVEYRDFDLTGQGGRRRLGVRLLLARADEELPSK